MRTIALKWISIAALLLAYVSAADPAVSRNCAGCDRMGISVQRSVVSRALENVSIKNFAFNAVEITVYVGDSVTWKNNDSVAHSSTSDTAIWNSGQLAGGESFTFVFTQVGEFPYYCSLHHDMKGKVVVLPLPSPLITSPSLATATVGTEFQYQIAASFSPASFNAANLPQGLIVNTSTGLISGVPLSAENGRVITVSATNATGTGQASLTLDVVLPPAPVINSALTAQGTLGVPFSYQITASSAPTLFEADNLPAGLALNSTGSISGTPQSLETNRPVALRATNAGGTGTAVLFLNIQQPAIPEIPSIGTLLAQAGETFSYQVSAANNPTLFSADGLPAGLAITDAGVIYGRPLQHGTFSATVIASNAAGSGVAIVAFQIAPANPILLDSILHANALLGVPFSFVIPASANTALTYQVDNLPAGLSLVQNRIEGVAEVPGQHAISIHASNPFVQAASLLTLNVSDPTSNGDTDGDGFGDTLELALGTSPLNKASVPVEIGTGVSAPLDLGRLQIVLNFKKQGADKITVAGRLPGSPDLEAGAQRAVFDIGGLVFLFSLDARGRAATTDAQFKLTSPGAQNSEQAFLLKASRGTFAAYFENEGLHSASLLRNQPRQVPVLLLLSQRHYSTLREVRYSAKPGRLGIAR